MELLKRYSEKSDGQWNRLPRDGYIYEYLAYHFFRSNDGSLPWNVFLDLSFVVEKLIEDGPVKLLTDYKRYEGFIGKWVSTLEFFGFCRRHSKEDVFSGRSRIGRIPRFRSKEHARFERGRCEKETGRLCGQCAEVGVEGTRVISCPSTSENDERNVAICCA